MTPTRKKSELLATAAQAGLGLPAPGGGGLSSLSSNDPMSESQMIVTLDEIRPYERNPRRVTPNPQYPAIKDSVRNDGLHQVLKITRRPGDAHYILDAGGGTRYQILRELYEETGDDKYFRISVIFRPWSNEKSVLSRHLTENIQRGEMCFWDTAVGVMELKQLMEKDGGKVLSLREFESATQNEGLSLTKTAIARYMFATSSLVALGEAALPYLTPRLVSDLQPHFGRYVRVAAEYSLDGGALHSLVLDPVLSEYGQRFLMDDRPDKIELESLLTACTDALATQCGVAPDWLSKALDAMRAEPTMDFDAVKQAVSAGNSSSLKKTKPATAPAPRRSASKSDLAKPRQPNNLEPLPHQDEPLLQTFLTALRQFAFDCGVDDAINFDETGALPYGYWMGKTDINPQLDSLQHYAWWMLATMSQQWISDESDKAWHTLLTEELEVPSAIPPEFPDTFGWIGQFPDDVYESFINLMNAYRQLHILGGAE